MRKPRIAKKKTKGEKVEYHRRHGIHDDDNCYNNNIIIISSL